MYGVSGYQSASLTTSNMFVYIGKLLDNNFLGDIVKELYTQFSNQVFGQDDIPASPYTSSTKSLVGLQCILVLDVNKRQDFQQIEF
jgi:hypothetical protein